MTYFKVLCSIRTLIVDLRTFHMTKGPDLAPHGRWDHGCSTIKYPNGTNLIIGKKHDAFKKYNRFTKNSRFILRFSSLSNINPVFNLFWIHSQVAWLFRIHNTYVEFRLILLYGILSSKKSTNINLPFPYS